MGATASASAVPFSQLQDPSCPLCRPQGPKGSQGPPVLTATRRSALTEKGRCSGRAAQGIPPAFAARLLRALEEEDPKGLLSTLKQNKRGPSQADALAFAGDAACLHVLFAAMHQQWPQQTTLLEILFTHGCSVDSTWPSASFRPSEREGRAVSSLSCNAAAGEAKAAGPPRSFTHLCVQRPASALASDHSTRLFCSSSSGMWGRRGPDGPSSGGAPRPAVLQTPKAAGCGWGPISDTWFFYNGNAAAGESKQQQQLLHQLKNSPLLLVGEVGLLYSRIPVVHHLIAELTQQPRRLLVAAAAASSPAVLQRLLQRGANPNYKRHGLSALGVAAACGSAAEEKARLLLAFGAAPEAPISYVHAENEEAVRTAVQAKAAKRLAAFGLKYCIRFSLRQAAEAAKAQGNGGFASSASGEIPSVSDLEAAGAALMAPVVIGVGEDLPALLQAAINRNLELMQLLLENGASPDVFVLSAGLPSPLFFSVFWGILPAVRLLLAYGANPFIAKEDGEGLEATARRALQFSMLDKPRHIMKLPLPKASPAVCRQILALIDTAQRHWASYALEHAGNGSRGSMTTVTKVAGRGLPAAVMGPKVPVLLRSTWETSVCEGPPNSPTLGDCIVNKKDRCGFNNGANSTNKGDPSTSSSSTGGNSARLEGPLRSVTVKEMGLVPLPPVCGPSAGSNSTHFSVKSEDLASKVPDENDCQGDPPYRLPSVTHLFEDVPGSPIGPFVDPSSRKEKLLITKTGKDVVVDGLSNTAAGGDAGCHPDTKSWPWAPTPAVEALRGRIRTPPPFTSSVLTASTDCVPASPPDSHNTGTAEASPIYVRQQQGPSVPVNKSPAPPCSALLPPTGKPLRKPPNASELAPLEEDAFKQAHGRVLVCRIKGKEVCVSLLDTERGY
ncbi:uncharacterized protein LOC34620686 [Cyclospora cayetanensis]|uniref:Uncharacterized protein LOC34620686 n=1 Tax=Cyclospora cayetanensis TaxID=88456 RepID=A0A6P6RYU9_9EIME|nr:uncharacterized protein LOC34620686 [Cyclospora cayetanensis]